MPADDEDASLRWRFGEPRLVAFEDDEERFMLRRAKLRRRIVEEGALTTSGKAECARVARYRVERLDNWSDAPSERGVGNPKYIKLRIPVVAHAEFRNLLQNLDICAI